MIKHLKKVHKLVQGLMTGKKHPMWAVAAAIAWLESGSWPIATLEERVMSSRLSGLGSRGGKTTVNTLRTDIDTRHSDIFKRSGCRGYYEVATEAARQSTEVRRAAADILAQYFEEYCRLVQKLLRVPPHDLSQYEQDVARIRKLDHFIQRVGILRDDGM